MTTELRAVGRESAASGSLDRVTAAILAGGLGTRLRSVVGDRPKVLAPILGRPFLTFVLDQLVDAGVRRVVLCTGHLGQAVRATFGQSYRSLDLSYAQERDLLGTGGALRHALPLLDSDPVLVLNGDSICPGDLVTFLDWHQASRAAGTLMVVRAQETARFGLVHMNQAREITRFAEKVEGGPSVDRGWISAGVYLLSRRLIRLIPEGRPISLERDVFPLWAGRGLYGYPARGPLLDIGTPESYSRAESYCTRLARRARGRQCATVR